MVAFVEIVDKRSQQRRRRADGAVRSVADRSAIEEDRALAPPTAQAAQERSPVGRQLSGLGRDSVDSAQRGSLAGPAEGVSASIHVLATAAGLGRAGRLADHLARIPERVERTPAVALEGIVPRWQFRSGEKRGCAAGKTKRGKRTKWMVVVDGAGIYLRDHLHSASPAEVRLAETTLPATRVWRRHHAGRPRQKPVRVIADNAYDSDPLRKRLQRRGIELISRTRRIVFVQRHKTVGRCCGSAAAGSWSAPSAGWGITVAWLSATTVPCKSTAPSFMSPAS